MSPRRPARRPLLAVDAPSLLFRAYYALPRSIKGAGGHPVNALLGSVNMMLREIERHDPRAVVMCFGQDAADYRVELFEDYHADREPMEEDIGRQFEKAPDLYAALGWKSAAVPGLEADDVLGSFALAEQSTGGRALLLTGDRDMFQCVTDRCQVLYLRTGGGGAELIDEAGVRSRYGIPPPLVPDLIALRGDPSDGIPGARGIGDKTAADLLRRHGSLEGALAAWAGESPRVRAALHGQAGELRDFKEVATLRTIAVELPPDTPTDWEAGAATARALGMNALADRLQRQAGG